MTRSAYLLAGMAAGVLLTAICAGDWRAPFGDGLQSFAWRNVMGGFHVMSRRCDQCLLSPERIVSSRRAASILKNCAQNDTHFICHKGTIAGRDIGCRGHFDTSPGKNARFAQWLGVIIEVDPDTLETVCEGIAQGDGA